MSFQSLCQKLGMLKEWNKLVSKLKSAQRIEDEILAGRIKVFENAPLVDRTLVPSSTLWTCSNSQQKFGPKDKVRVLWVLASTQRRTVYIDKEGKHFTHDWFLQRNRQRQSEPDQGPPSDHQRNAANVEHHNGHREPRSESFKSLLLTQEPDARKPGQFVTLVAGISPALAGRCTTAGSRRFRSCEVAGPKQTAGRIPASRPRPTHSSRKPRRQSICKTTRSKPLGQ